MTKKVTVLSKSIVNLFPCITLYKYRTNLIKLISMLRSSFLVFSLLKHRSIPISTSSIVLYNPLSSISKPTHLRSFVKVPNLSSGYSNFTPLSQRFRLQQHSMASDSSSQPQSIYDFTVKVRCNSMIISFSRIIN